MQPLTCETSCPLVRFCDIEVAKRREELVAIGDTALIATESYSDTLQRYNELKERLAEDFAEELSPTIIQAAVNLEIKSSGFRENTVGWIDTKQRRIDLILKFRKTAKSNCDGPLQKRKFILLGGKVTRCSAHYNKLEYFALKVISRYPRVFPDDLDV